MDNYRSWFDEMEREGIHMTPEQREKINSKINSILNYEPKIGVFGKTGVGKSSLCNALFGQDICPISDVEACTRNPQEVLLKMGGKGIKLVDVPGVGESEERDKEYAKLYAELLPELDVVLWLIKADDRALSTEETFYKNVIKPHVDQNKPFFFVISQVDKIEPIDWNATAHEPGAKQFQSMYRKVDVVANQFGFPASRVIPVSANEKYNLTKLVDEIVFALPNDKKITVFKNVDKEHQSSAAKENAKKGFLEVIGETVQEVVHGVVEAVEIVSNTAREVMDWIDSHTPSWWPFW